METVEIEGVKGKSRSTLATSGEVRRLLQEVVLKSDIQMYSVSPERHVCCYCNLIVSKSVTNKGLGFIQNMTNILLQTFSVTYFSLLITFFDTHCPPVHSGSSLIG